MSRVIDTIHGTDVDGVNGRDTHALICAIGVITINQTISIIIGTVDTRFAFDNRSTNRSTNRSATPFINHAITVVIDAVTKLGGAKVN